MTLDWPTNNGRKIVLQPRGGWTNQDVRDMEDNLYPERFQITGAYVSVKRRSTKAQKHFRGLFNNVAYFVEVK